MRKTGQRATARVRQWNAEDWRFGSPVWVFSEWTSLISLLITCKNLFVWLTWESFLPFSVFQTVAVKKLMRRSFCMSLDRDGVYGWMADKKTVGIDKLSCWLLGPAAGLWVICCFLSNQLVNRHYWSHRLCDPDGERTASACPGRDAWRHSVIKNNFKIQSLLEQLFHQLKFVQMFQRFTFFGV